MFIDLAKLKQNVSAWLKTGEGKKLLDEMSGSFIVDLILTLISIVIGLILTLTIIKAKTGLSILWSAITLQEFGSSGPNQQDILELVKPIILHGVISGPEGHSAVIGTFDPYLMQDVDRLGALAQRLARIYLADEVSPDDRELRDLIRQDRYVNNRRRLLPESATHCEQIWVFDILLDVTSCGLRSTDQVLYAAIATEGPVGSVRQIPWSVVANAISLD